MKPEARMFALLLLSAALALVAVASSSGKAPKSGKDKKNSDKAVTLKDLFPEKRLFGPSASSTAFSFDGKYAAYLYRPYVERRHGSDLWMLDTRSGKPRRVTSVSVMSEFQADTRKVKEDRIKKARQEQARKDAKAEKDEDADKSAKSGKKKSARDKKKKKDDAKNGEQDDEDGDRVGEKDADDEKAPRYGGIQSYTFSPVAEELLFLSADDIYRYDIAEDEITRLTCTRERERGVQYLPDGSGYTYMRDGALMKVAFDSHLIEQLDPKLEKGESMIGYRLSPDGARIVFLTNKSGKAPKPQRKVKIAQYTERFVKIREVPRTVSDDPQTPTTRSVYLYDPRHIMNEDGELLRVHSHEISGPRDIFRVPEWSPDSTRVTFAVFTQSTGQVEILEADFPPKDDEDAAEGDDAGAKKVDSDKASKDDDDEDDGNGEEGDGENAEDEKSKESGPEQREARVVYRFFHNGGPTTPSMVHPRYLADSRRIVFTSEQTGFRQLHVLDPLYQSTEPLTQGRYEVYPVAMTRDHKLMFVTATREDASRREVYVIDTDSREMARLSDDGGDYSSVAVSPDGKKMLANYVTYGKLRELVYDRSPKGKPKTLTDSHPEKAHEYTKAIPEFFTYENRHGQEIHGQMFKPDDWSADDKRPLLIYVYGGPLGTRKMVVDGSYSGDAYFFAWYMAKEHGYVTCTIDPRGTSGYGGLFEKSNFEQVGKPQVEDLVDGVKWFVKNQGVDEKRVGIHGWSFGGFQTQMCLYTAPDVFACGMAGAGPTEWENYNSWYSTGTIGNSRAGRTDLKKYSLLPLAKNLKAKLLLLHGMEDSNVLYQDTVRVYRELLKAHKETLVELFLDPTGGHGLGGDVKRLARMRKYEEFLVRCLGESGEDQ